MRSDSESHGPQSDDEATQDVSNQNREEPSAPHQGAHGNPSPSEGENSKSSSHAHEGTEGGAGESTQATGDPKSAG